MRINYSSPLTRDNAGELLTELQKAYKLRKVSKQRFYLVSLIRFGIILLATTFIFMFLFDEYRQLFPGIYSFLNDIIIITPQSLNIPPALSIPLWLIILIAFSYFVGYVFSYTIEKNITKKSADDLSNDDNILIKNELEQLFKRYLALEKGSELVASLILSSLTGLYGFSIAMLCGEGFLTAFLSFILSAIMMFILSIISNTEVLSDACLKKISCDIERFIKEDINNEKEVDSEKKHAVDEEEMILFETMSPDEIYEYGKQFLGINTKKCFEIMKAAQSRGSIPASQFMFSLAHKCSYFSNGICKKKSVNGSVEYCFHDDGTWIMCEDYN